MNHISTKQIQTYRAQFPEETAITNAFEHFLNEKKKPLQTNDKISGSAWIFNPSNGKVLLTHHKKLNKWVQLGGHYEANDSQNIMNTALREAKEESGIEEIYAYSENIFNINIYLSEKNKSPYYLYDFCFLFHTQQENITQSHESKDLQWLSTGKISTSKNFKSIKNLSKKWQLFCFEHMQKNSI